MSATERTRRLRIETRLAILENIRVLRAQRRVARQQGDPDSAQALHNLVDALLDQLDELAAISLEVLEDSDEVKAVVSKLRQTADELEADADNITDLQTARVQGAQAVQRFTSLINGMRGLVPIPA
jgi:predicted DNA-binding ArsR family transcriptional regulator